MLLLRPAIICAIAVLLFSETTLAQNAFENALMRKMDSLVREPGPELARIPFLPNNSIQSIMTPSGWGGNGSYIYGVVGGVYPALYTQKADMIGAIGFCFGNSAKYINVSASVNITRLSELRDLSYNIVLSRRIFKGSSISVGGLQLFSDPVVSDAPAGTYYIAFSHSVQTLKAKTEGYSPLTYTIGVGNGRFLLKSPYDVLAGKGKYGTGVFASVSYEIFRNINLNAEWSGMNLGFSSGIRPIKNFNGTIGFGVYNLTKYSGDKPTFLASFGYPIALGRRDGVERRSNKDKNIRKNTF
ncbi:MAG: hypothetical protein EOO89_20890 [Pedobacter sp.]|nr:MAG: hypothetical protein EOO89_20890 [Pedobacter sp.]